MPDACTNCLRVITGFNSFGKTLHMGRLPVGWVPAVLYTNKSADKPVVQRLSPILHPETGPADRIGGLDKFLGKLQDMIPHGWL
jgi:hypothetical protein